MSNDSTDPLAIRPMEDAPQTGKVIEVLYEGDFLRVYWSDRADDMSPHGTEGWADEDSGLLILDMEGWRYPEIEGFVDLQARRDEEIEHARQYEIDKKRAARKKPRPRAIVRAELEARYLELFGNDISSEKRSFPSLRADINRESNRLHRENSGKALTSFMSGMGF